MDFLSNIENSNTAKLILSALLLLGLVVLRTVAARSITRHIVRSDARRKWLVNVRNALVFLAIISLAAIWAEALRTFAVSILAVAVAFVIATKELLQSISGSMMRSVTNAYSIGDRIEIGSHRGDVIDQNMFTTTILEVGPGRSFHLRTGRIITFPNSKLLDSYVINESYTKQYTIHVFSIPLKVSENWKEAEKILLKAAEDECAYYLDLARQTMKHLEESHGLDGLPVKPRVHVQIPEPNRINLLVRLPTPVGKQGRIEQAIMRRFLNEYCVKDTGETVSSSTAQLPLIELPPAENI